MGSAGWAIEKEIWVLQTREHKSSDILCILHVKNRVESSSKYWVTNQSLFLLLSTFLNTLPYTGLYLLMSDKDFLLFAFTILYFIISYTAQYETVTIKLLFLLPMSVLHSEDWFLIAQVHTFSSRDVYPSHWARAVCAWASSQEGPEQLREGRELTCHYIRLKQLFKT